MNQSFNKFCNSILLISFCLLLLACKNENQEKLLDDGVFPPYDFLICSGDNFDNYANAYQFSQNTFSTQLELFDQFDQIANVFTQNEVVKLVLTLENLSNDNQIICFNDGQQFDFVLLTNDEQQTIKWIWSLESAFIQPINGIRLAAGETKTWAIKTTLNTQQQINNGNYKIQAIIELPDVLVGDSNSLSQFRSNFVEIAIQ